MKTIFQCLSVVGLIVIIFLTFLTTSDPFLVIPALSIFSFDKPIWFCIILSSGFIYLLLLWFLYDKLKKKNSIN